MLLLDKIVGEFQRGLYVRRRDAVLPLDIFRRHPPRKSADDSSDGNPRTSNDGFAVLGLRVDLNAVVRGR